MPREVAEILEELLAWTRFAHTEGLRGLLRTELSERASFIAFQLSDGSRSQREVAEAAGVSQPTISRWWARWSRQGIMRQVGETPTHLIDPADLGLEVPPATPM